MGHVYLAMHSGPAGVEKLVVLKHLREDLATSIASRSMFLDEARLSTRLNHPNIVQTNDVVDEGDDLYLVMDFLDGQPLSRLLMKEHTDAFPLATKLRIIMGVLEGLHYAHDLTDYDGRPLNVVHRDVSPQNIVVTYEGHVKLLDFGVAKAAGQTTVTETGVFKGKVRYASAEQALCAKVDRRSDIFAVGTILWEIVAGQRMWKAEADASVLVALASGQIPSLREACPDVPPELEAIVLRALAPDPSGRFPSALDFRNALADYLRTLVDDVDLGGAMQLSFVKERAELAATIDSQVKALREASSGRLTMRDLPVIAAESTSSLGNEKSIGRSALAMEPPSLRPSALGKKRSTSWIVLAAVAGVLAVVGGITLLGGSSKGSPPAAAPAPASTAEAYVHLSLHATPASARFVLDGIALPTNPYEGDVARDDGAHKVTIEATGYDKRAIETRFSRDVNLVVALTPKPVVPTPATSGASASAAPRYTPPRTAAAAPKTMQSPPKRPDRNIDEEDPYKQ